MRGPSLLRRRSRPVEQDGLLFKQSDIPPVDLWRQFKTHRGLGDLTPETCLSVVMQYCDVATQTSGLWKEALERGMSETATQPMLSPLKLNFDRLQH
jgi:hypothetical protein